MTSSKTEAPRDMSGGHLLALMLRAHGAGPMFGMGGYQLLPFYNAISELGLDHHLVNDERSGAFAADAYARVTGRPGICDATLGPGATNLVTPLVEALNAGVPLIAVIGDASRQYTGRNMTQEARQVDILRPAAKELIRIEDGSRIPELVRRAYHIATSGRPGPVVIDVPEDVAHGTVSISGDEIYADEESTTVPLRRARPDSESIEAAARLIRQSARPLILVGGGVHLSGAYDELRRLAELLGIPVAHTLTGKGALACTHALSAGLFGRFSRYANELIESSDCLIVVGCKLGEIATRRYELPPQGSRVIHLDIDPGEIGRTTSVAVGLWGDAAMGLRDLADATELVAPRVHQRAEGVRSDLERLRLAWHATTSEVMHSRDEPIHMARLINELDRHLPEDAILVADGGFAAHWSGLFFNTKRPGRTYIADRGFASIGYGLPGAIGAASARPTSPVVALTGDAGLNMTIGELETALRMGLGITVVTCNNAASGYVKALQYALYDGRYQSADLHELNYADIAKAFGCNGIRVHDPELLGDALRSGMSETSRPTVIDVVVTRDPARMLPGIDSRASPRDAPEKDADAEAEPNPISMRS